MPYAAPRPCSHVGCGVLVRDGTSRCPAHKVQRGSFADRSRGTRHERGYDYAWEKKRTVVIDRDGGLCQPCLREDRVVIFSAVDHIVSKAEAKRRGWTREQTDDAANLQCICTSCHKAKTAAERG